MIAHVWIAMIAVSTMLFAVGCSNGKKATTLSRPTALTILKEQSKLISGAEKYDGKTRELIFHGARPNDEKRGELTIAFLEVLVKTGVLNNKVAQEVPAGHDALGMAYPAHTQYRYSIVQQEDVQPMYPGTQDEIVYMTVGKPAPKEIVGIQQEGSEALVEALVAQEPTKIYEKVADEAKGLLQQCKTIPTDARPYYCVHWPSRETLGKAERRTFHFTRYDDGWRVVE